MTVLLISSKVKHKTIICSIIQNWQNEYVKWLKGRVTPLAIDSGSRQKIDKDLESFVTARRVVYPVLILSYETLRLHIDALLKGLSDIRIYYKIHCCFDYKL